MRMRAVLAVTAPGDHHGGNGMLENQLFLIVRFQHHGVFIERTNAPRKLHSAEQINGDMQLVFACRVEERILYVLRRLIVHLPIFLPCVFHTCLSLVDRSYSFYVFIVALRLPGDQKLRDKQAVSSQQSAMRLPWVVSGF